MLCVFCLCISCGPFGLLLGTVALLMTPNSVCFSVLFFSSSCGSGAGQHSGTGAFAGGRQGLAGHLCQHGQPTCCCVWHHTRQFEGGFAAACHKRCCIFMHFVPVMLCFPLKFMPACQIFSSCSPTVPRMLLVSYLDVQEQRSETYMQGPLASSTTTYLDTIRVKSTHCQTSHRSYNRAATWHSCMLLCRRPALASHIIEVFHSLCFLCMVCRCVTPSAGYL